MLFNASQCDACLGRLFTAAISELPPPSEAPPAPSRCFSCFFDTARRTWMRYFLETSGACDGGDDCLLTVGMNITNAAGTMSTTPYVAYNSSADDESRSSDALSVLAGDYVISAAAYAQLVHDPLLVNFSASVLDGSIQSLPCGSTTLTNVVAVLCGDVHPASPQSPLAKWPKSSLLLNLSADGGGGGVSV